MSGIESTSTTLCTCGDLAYEGLLCRPCFGRLRRDLDNLETAAPGLEQAMLPFQGWRPKQEGGAPTKLHPPAPTNVTLLSALDPRSSQTKDCFPVLAALREWSALLIAEANLANPNCSHGATPHTDECVIVAPATLTENAALLRVHIHHIANAQWVFAAADEIRQAAFTVARFLGTLNARPLATCTVPVDEDGTPCNGPISSSDRTRLEAHCTSCGTKWEPHDILTHATIADIYLRPSDLMLLTSVSESNLHYWARKGIIRQDASKRYGKRYSTFDTISRLIDRTYFPETVDSASSTD